MVYLVFINYYSIVGIADTETKAFELISKIPYQNWRDAARVVAVNTNEYTDCLISIDSHGNSFVNEIPALYKGPYFD